MIGRQTLLPDDRSQLLANQTSIIPIVESSSWMVTEAVEPTFAMRDEETKLCHQQLIEILTFSEGNDVDEVTAAINRVRLDGHDKET